MHNLTPGRAGAVALSLRVFNSTASQPRLPAGGRWRVTMKHMSLGGLDVSRIGLGAMSMSGYYNVGEGSETDSIRAIHRALELGVTHLDTAEIYGPFLNEELVGRAIKGRRGQVVLATK